ncbi:MAG TPA: hypothetical protein VFZ23_08490 [Pyrinomonadaceae bacterium]
MTILPPRPGSALGCPARTASKYPCYEIYFPNISYILKKPNRENLPFPAVNLFAGRDRELLFSENSQRNKSCEK